MLLLVTCSCWRILDCGGVLVVVVVVVVVVVLGPARINRRDWLNPPVESRLLIRAGGSSSCCCCCCCSCCLWWCTCCRCLCDEVTGCQRDYLVSDTTILDTLNYALPLPGTTVSRGIKSSGSKYYFVWYCLW